MKVSKNHFIKGYLAAILILAIVRLGLGFVNPDLVRISENVETKAEEAEVQQSEPTVSATPQEQEETASENLKEHVSHKPEGKKHPINSVPSYRLCFPDTNAVQLVAAQRWGIKRVQNRADAEARKRELVYVGSSPFYTVDRLTNSIPYLVPRAAILLNDIGRAFFDSLYVKGVPLNQLIVTSVLRTQDDVTRLRRRNGNATENSCHLYGTTFDICYNRYHPVTRPVRNDTLKWVLSEVLRDMREQGRCYIKYEVKQGCFHMTVR